MRVFNKDKTEELQEYDIAKGRLIEEVLITHCEEIKEVQEQFHYEVVRQYDNGGQDVKKVIDVEGVKYKPARDEKEDILVYVPYTKEELHKIELNKELEELIMWFDEYDNQVKQYERCVRLGIEYDKDIVALDNEATQKQLRIREIRSELNGK